MSKPWADFDKALIIGYGNVDRQDNGIAWYVLADLAHRLGIPGTLDPDLDCAIDTPAADLRFMLQLTPEIAELIASYSRVCFLDACAQPQQQDVQITELMAQYQPSPMTHHMTPETCLSICQALYQCQPDAVLVSVTAHDFGFSRSLSEKTLTLIKPAADQIMDWLSTPVASRPLQAAEMHI